LRLAQTYFAELRKLAIVSAYELQADKIHKLFGSVGASASGGGDSSGFGGPVGAHADGRAGGGPVSGGMPYKVGERGPELFVPRTAGTVLSNAQTTNNAYGGHTVNVSIVANDPNAVWEILRKKLQDSEVWR
jgi:hypothetical protein